MSQPVTNTHNLNSDFLDEREEMKDQYVSDCEWMEIRLQGKLPERRSNHSAFIYENQAHRYYFVHGGRDLKEGALDNMWKLDLNDLQRLMEDPYYNCSWELIQQRGSGPNRISHHTCAVSGDKIIIVGGLQGDSSNRNIYVFEILTYTWSLVSSSTGDVPLPRDDHSLNVWGKDFIICGGFVNGSRVNDVYDLDFNPQSKAASWRLVHSNNRSYYTQQTLLLQGSPQPRNSHTSVVIGDNLYILGGQDDENNKLDDLWEMNLTSGSLKQIQFESPEGCVVGRSGHTAVAYGNKMFVFGGMLEVTKELNDLISFDIKTKHFTVIDPNGEGDHAYNSRFDDSQHQSTLVGMKLGHNDSNSPNARARRFNQSPNKRTSYQNQNQSPSKKPTQTTTSTGDKSNQNKAGSSQKEEQKGLSSPTSISMYNSFIIKNADESFDQYYHSMKKRKHGNNQSLLDQSVNNANAHETKFGVVRGKKPTPRDGHTANVDSNGFMYVFGGDRHHMKILNMIVKLNYLITRHQTK